MSLHLHFAPEAGLLGERLVQDLRSRWTANPLDAPLVIAPNPAVKRWLLLRMAGNMGSVLGANISTLERTLWKWLDPRGDFRRLAVDEAQLVLLDLLRGPLLDEARFAPVRQYLCGDGTTVDALKRVQLVGYLARQFQEYEFNRPSVWDADAGRWALPGMTASWRLGKLYPFRSDGRDVPTQVRAQELWQAELYRQMMERLDALDGPRCLTMPQLLEERRKGDPQWRVPPGDVYLFLVSKISHWHRNLLVDISQMPGVRLQVFLTNPCAEFWEDVDTWGKRQRRVQWTCHDAAGREGRAGVGVRVPDDYQREEMKAEFFESSDPRLLELWGNSARENIALWCPAAEWDFHYHRPAWVDAQEQPGLGCLRALQLSLLRREAALLPGVSADSSLQVLAAPDVGREVEELREQILNAVEDKTVSCLEEVVVYLTDPAAYLPHIHRVFGAESTWESGHVAWNLLGAPGAGSLYGQAVQALLVLLEGRYDRAAVFTLLRNPVWQASHRANAAMVAIWEKWAEGTGMIRGFDSAHRQAMGDLGGAASDLHTFGLGIGRLLVGSLASGAVDLGYPLPLEGYRDFETSDAGLLEQFLATLEDLYHDLACWPALSLAEALQKVRVLCDKWLPSLPTDAGWNPVAEARVRQQFLDALQGLQGMAARLEAASGTAAVPMDKTELLALVRGLLPEELAAGSKAWLGGVTFAPLRMGMVLPHKMVCVLGLGAKEFPGVPTQSALDLLSEVRKVGDSHPVRDNQLAFLELLHAAQSRLVLSWRARNLQKEEELQPSSVLLELLAELKRQGVEPLRRLPLSLWEDLPSRVWSETPLWLSAATREERAAWRFAPGPGRAAGGRELDAGVVSGAELQAFFSNPLKYHVAKSLGLRDGERLRSLDVKDEPLRTDGLDMALLQNALWARLLGVAFPERAEDALRSDDELEGAVSAAVEQLYLRHQGQGAAPLSPFDHVEKERLRHWGMQRISALAALRELGFADHRLVARCDLSLGRAQGAAALQLAGLQVRLWHDWVLVPRAGQGATGLVGFASKGEARDHSKAWLAAVLQGLHERSLPVEMRASPLLMLQLNRGEEGNKMVSGATVLDGAEPVWDKMEAYLVDLAGELRAGHAEHLPFATVQAVLGDPLKQYFAARKNGAAPSDPFEHLSLAALQENLDSDYGAYRVYDDYWSAVEARLPVEEALVRALARKRFAPMLERWVHA
jgi:exonuclease V gamma subunit